MKKILIAAGVLLVLAAVAVYMAGKAGRDNFDQRVQAASMQMEALIAKGQAAYGPADLARVPAVMRAYLQEAMPSGGLYTNAVLLSQSGRIKMTEDNTWDHYSARQLITREPRQAAWAARVDYGPLMPVMTLNLLGGDGASVKSYLWGLIEMFGNQGEVLRAYLMLRWLGEAVWHPDALLPGEGLSWQEAEAPKGSGRAARVILQEGNIKVSGRFIFDSTGGAPLMFLADEMPLGRLAGQRWYCTYSDWRRQGKRQIPFALTQGVRMSASDDVRLKIKLEEIVYR